MVRWPVAISDASSETLRVWLGDLRGAESEGFRPLASVADLPDADGVEQESREWSGRFLRPEFDPWQQPEGASVERSAHFATERAPDVLRSRFTTVVAPARGLPERSFEVTVLETTDLLRVAVREAGVDLRAIPDGADRANAVGALAELVVPMQGTYAKGRGARTPYAWVFRHGPLDEGAHFSTNPGAEVLMLTSWVERFDGGLAADGAYFVGFKTRDGEGRVVYLDAQHWFDGACWRASRTT